MGHLCLTLAERCSLKNFRPQVFNLCFSRSDSSAWIANGRYDLARDNSDSVVVSNARSNQFIQDYITVVQDGLKKFGSRSVLKGEWNPLGYILLPVTTTTMRNPRNSSDYYVLKIEAPILRSTSPWHEVPVVQAADGLVLHAMARKRAGLGGAMGEGSEHANMTALNSKLIITAKRYLQAVFHSHRIIRF